MRYRTLMMLVCLLLTATVHAQPDDPYAEALRRIEEARNTGATTLDLSKLDLTEVPPEIGALSALTYLDLYDNQLTVLPPEIGSLTALTELYLSSNQLTELPPEFRSLTALTALSLSNNQLTRLPEIGNLTPHRFEYFKQPTDGLAAGVR